MDLNNSLSNAIDQSRESIVRLAKDLVRFDTTVPDPGAKPREEKDCQAYIADLLRELGLEVDQWEPDTSSLRDLQSFMQRQNYKDRPLTVGVLRGKGGGKSLLLNAHIDTVPADPVDKWRHDPWSGEVEGDRLYGRGACDMKAGAAAMIKALETIRAAGIELKGDVILEFVLDEELNGMGTAACIRRGYRADAAIIPEPTDLRIVLARRGLLYGRMTVRGRSGHAEMRQSHRLEGGAVNAIEKTILLLGALKELEADWQDRPDKRHKYLSNPKIVPTKISGGAFECTYPEQCELVFDAQYIKSNADKIGWGGLVKQEIQEQIQRACECDAWLRENRPIISWTDAFPPSEVDEKEPVVETLRSAVIDGIGMTPCFGGNDSSDDCSYLITTGGMPSVSFGPSPSAMSHTIDEYVSIESMTKATKALAFCILRWCGHRSTA